MAQIPLDPELAKMLLSAEKYNCMNEVLSLVSILSTPNIFQRPKEYAQEADASKAKYIFK